MPISGDNLSLVVYSAQLWGRRVIINNSWIIYELIHVGWQQKIVWCSGQLPRASLPIIAWVVARPARPSLAFLESRDRCQTLQQFRSERYRKGGEEKPKATAQRTAPDWTAAARPPCGQRAARRPPRTEPSRPTRAFGREPPAPTASPFAGRLAAAAVPAFFFVLGTSVHFPAGTWRNEDR